MGISARFFQSGRDLELHRPRIVATFDEYTQAQRAVSYLLDNQFPGRQLQIVGRGVKQVERVIGKISVVNVAVMGLLNGFIYGTLISMIVYLLNGDNYISWSRFAFPMAAGLVLGLVNAFYRFSKANQAGGGIQVLRRLVADSYELLADASVVETARTMLYRANEEVRAQRNQPAAPDQTGPTHSDSRPGFRPKRPEEATPDLAE